MYLVGERGPGRPKAKEPMTGHTIRFPKSLDDAISSIAAERDPPTTPSHVVRRICEIYFALRKEGRAPPAFTPQKNGKVKSRNRPPGKTRIEEGERP